MACVALLVLFMVSFCYLKGRWTVPQYRAPTSVSKYYGLYTGAVYFLAYPGGWIADRLIGGPKKAVFLWRFRDHDLGSYHIGHPFRLNLFLRVIFVVLGYSGFIKNLTLARWLANCLWCKRPPS